MTQAASVHGAVSTSPSFVASRLSQIPDARAWAGPGSSRSAEHAHLGVADRLAHGVDAKIARDPVAKIDGLGYRRGSHPAGLRREPVADFAGVYRVVVVVVVVADYRAPLSVSTRTLLAPPVTAMSWRHDAAS